MWKKFANAVSIEMRRGSGMAKIDGVDDGDGTEGAGGREESDEWEGFGSRRWCASTILASQVCRRRRNTR